MTGTRLLGSLVAGLTGLLLMSPVQAAPLVENQSTLDLRLRLATPRLLAEIPNRPPATAFAAEPPGAHRATDSPYTLGYEPGQPIPPGYRVVSGFHSARLALASVTFGISYTVSVFLAGVRTEASSTAESFDQVPYDPRWLYAPIIGPWVALATSKAHDCRNSYYASSYFYGQCDSANSHLASSRVFLVIDGILQGASAVGTVFWITHRWYRLVLTDNVHAQVLPVPMGRSGEGLALVGRFGGL
jgi:hypothetical protein